jgi:hypothetical protein
MAMRVGLNTLFAGDAATHFHTLRCQISFIIFLGTPPGIVPRHHSTVQEFGGSFDLHRLLKEAVKKEDAQVPG